jgi:hypothetical protein
VNKTEASYVNTLLRYLFDDDDSPGEESARWVAAGLAERAHKTMAAGISRGRCEQLWDERPPTPGRRPREHWEETAEGLAAADAADGLTDITIVDPAPLLTVVDDEHGHRSIAIVAELRNYLETHGPGSGEQHSEGELAVLADLRLMLDGRPSYGGRPTLAPNGGTSA